MRVSSRTPAAVILLLALAGASSPSPAHTQQESVPCEQAAQQVLDRYFEARGGHERIQAIRSLVFSQGQYSEGDYVGRGDAFMAFMRPYLRVVGDPEKPGGYMEGYDGAAWEWYADPGIVLRTVGAASRATRRVADPEGPFADYREKGLTLCLRPDTELDGMPVHRIEVTTPDGLRNDAYFDRRTHLLVAASQAAPIHAYGPNVETLSRFGDYRPVAGVLFPHRDATWKVATGEILSQMQWGRIEANRELPSTWFSPPVFVPTRLQALLHNLYGERTDTEAVLWSYREFRRAHPDIDTREGIEVIGFQMLKMGDVEAAQALLRANAEDHPDSASSRFGLARALRQAGDLAGARAEAETALRLDPGEERAARLIEELSVER